MIKIPGQMIKWISFVNVLALMAYCPSAAQPVGKVFPDMGTRTLQEETVNLPGDASGKFTLLGLAFSKKSEDDLITWLVPVYEKFIGNESGTLTRLFADMTYDVNVYFVPMFTGINTPATKPAMKKALDKVDPRLHPYILFYKGKLKPYKETLSFKKKDIPYLFVLDERGEIIYTTTGAYDGRKMDEIEKILE
jgi:hypothetical protein